jgi:hypothetical protein
MSLDDQRREARALVDWQDEMERRGKLDCKFVCPNCGLASSPNDFKALGILPERAAKECIGRHTKECGCDWAAYGLFRGPAFVALPDGGTSPVFEFAEARTFVQSPADPRSVQATMPIGPA